MNKLIDENNKENVNMNNLPLTSTLDYVNNPNSKLVVTIVKKGFAYQVIKCGNDNGGKGAVILDGRGVSAEKKKFFGIDIAPEKEVVLMVVEEQYVYPIVKSIYAIADFKSNAKGFVFVLPIAMLID